MDQKEKGIEYSVSRNNHRKPSFQSHQINENEKINFIVTSDNTSHQVKSTLHFLCCFCTVFTSIIIQPFLISLFFLSSSRQLQNPSSQEYIHGSHYRYIHHLYNLYFLVSTFLINLLLTSLCCCLLQPKFCYRQKRKLPILMQRQ